MTYGEVCVNGDLLDLQCVNGDGWVMVRRDHVVAVELDWLIKNGQITVVTARHDYIVVYDEGDSGQACAEGYAEVTKWLGGGS